eukprot:7453539-Alexandrium_andersonii.AAC.1
MAPKKKAFEPLVVDTPLCLRGGMKKAWTPVPTKEFGGQTAFGVSTNEKWLLDHAFGNHQREASQTDAIQVVAEAPRAAADKAGADMGSYGGPASPRTPQGMSPS